jgi:hypothetical protein
MINNLYLKFEMILMFYNLSNLVLILYIENLIILYIINIQIQIKNLE